MLRIAGMGLAAAMLSVAPAPATAQPAGQAGQPAPFLHAEGHEHYVAAGGGRFVRYHFAILNDRDYPAALFVAAPSLPPCGRNANSSRAWVDVFDSAGSRLYGFCALQSPAQLSTIWFAVREGSPPPQQVHVEIIDRQTGIRYRSNAVTIDPCLLAPVQP